MPRVGLRQLILDELYAKHLLTAPALLERLEELGQRFNKTSVYRALDKLLSEGEICRQTFGGNEIVYELREHHHDHAVCTSCGTIQAVECQSDIKPEIKGFKSDHHHVTVFGLCQKCQRAQRS